MKNIARIILKYRVLIIVLTLVVTVALGINLRDIKINSDVTSYLPADDESVVLFKYIGQEFSSSWTGVIIIESEDIFTVKQIEEISNLTTQLQETGGVAYVTSLTNIIDIKATEDGFEVARLIDPYDLPADAEAVEKIKVYTLSQNMYNGKLISSDARYTLVLCQIDESQDKNAVAANIRTIVTESNLSSKYYFEGMPFQVQSILTFIVDDLLLLTPLIVIVIFLSLYLSFRSIRGVLLPVLAVGIGIVWTISLMAIFGVELTPLSDALPVILFAVGSAYGIHVINRIKLVFTDPERKQEQLIAALTEVGLAVFLAGITTFVGFLSFIFGSYLTIVRDFGIFAALGVLFILFLSITFIPAIISYFPPDKQKSSKNGVKDLLDRFLKHLAVVVISRRKLIFYVSIFILALSMLWIPQIKRKVDILEYFKKGSDIRISSSLMNKEFGGSIPIQVHVKGDILTPEALSIMDSTCNFLNSLQGVSNARSVADYVKKMNDAMGEGNLVPDSRDKIGNLWFMLEGEDMMSQMINYNKDEAVIYASMKNLDAKRIHEINDSINTFAASLSDNTIQLKATGLQAVYSKLDNSMMKNLIQSMLLAFVFIFFTMIFLLRSLKGALTGMITLFFSIGFIFGFMGFTGIALDIATILIASVTVGIGIDYSIHFVTTYRLYLQKTGDINSAIQNTITTTGRAIVINLVTIILGFLVLLFANLIPLQQLGILIAVTMFCSGFGSITLMPAIISMFKINIK